MSRGTEGPASDAGAPGRASTVFGGGASYFAVVFAVGFLLGIVRTVWLVPLLGERWAELAEMPIMLCVIYLAADWMVLRLALRGRALSVAAGVGIVALLLLLLAELSVVLGLRSLSLVEYFESRDPVSGTAYVMSLLLFAAMPALLSRRPMR